MPVKLHVKAENANYAAQVVRLPEPYKHPNADRLFLVNLNGNIVITGGNAKKDDKYIYFPVESALAKEYLAYSNSFRLPELNRDKTTKGFWEAHCRCKAVKLRGQPSMGYIIPVGSLVEWLVSIGVECTEEDFKDNTEFDFINDIQICEKYINKEALRKLHRAESNAKRGKVKRTSRLVDNQFRLHLDTPPLKKLIHEIQPEDMITITYKLHGCAWTGSKVLVKRKLPFIDRLARWIGVTVLEEFYDWVWSSRRVIKNQYEDQHKWNQHFYDTDVWSIAAKKLNASIEAGISLYGEIVGYTPTGQFIQGQYDYGCNLKEQEIYIYRITSTNVDGRVIEFTTEQIVSYCVKYGIKHVPILYRGKAKDLFPQLNPDNHWQQNFLAQLMETYLEKDCWMCRNPVPLEGIVLRKDADFCNVFKLKAQNFLLRESAELDKGVVSLEDLDSHPEITPDEPPSEKTT